MKIPSIQQLKKQDFSSVLEPTFQKKLESQKVYLFIGRLLEIVFSICALLFFAPFWILIILLIRIDSKGKAVFIHQRIGKSGKPFMLYKFRTMFIDSDSQEYAPVSLNDQRITRIGKFLRRTSLDELPQFINVLKGEMSLVGPRPEMEFIVKKYSDLERARLLVKPGITGLWQIRGRKDLPLQQNVEYDLYYIMHRSLWLDLKIILETIIVVWKGKGAY